MSLVKIQGNASGTGIFTIAAPNSNTDRTLTLPDNTGTILTTGTAGVPVNGPAFSAYAVGSNSMTAATLTKITFDTELFDTNNNFSSSRFTPTVAGYYRISAQVTGQNTCTGICYASIYVNGAQYKTGTYVQYSGSGTKFGVEGLVYCNGSTDYVEIYGFVPSTMGTYTAASYFTWFDGAMVRSA